MPKRHTLEKVKEIFLERNLKFLSSEYKWCMLPYDTECLACGNVWKIRLNDVRNGYGCPKCNGGVRLTQNEFIEKCNIVHCNFYDYSMVVYKNNFSKIKIICKKHGIFIQRAGHHLHSKSNCPGCTNSTISKQETEWLNSYSIPNNLRQIRFKLNGKVYIVDGYDPKTNTIYEFFGDFWHGNPSSDKCKKSTTNQVNKKSFQDLYQKTMSRIELFEKSGYNVVYIWERDWKKKNEQ